MSGKQHGCGGSSLAPDATPTINPMTKPTLQEKVRRAIRDCEPDTFAHTSEPALDVDEVIAAVDAVFDAEEKTDD